MRITTVLALYGYGARDSNGRIVGRLLDHDEDAITVTNADNEEAPLMIPHDLIRRFEVKRRNRGVVLLKVVPLATAGAAVFGAVVGGVAGLACDPNVYSDCDKNGFAEGAKGGALTGLVLGLIGGFAAPEWDDVRRTGLRSEDLRPKTRRAASRFSAQAWDNRRLREVEFPGQHLARAGRGRRSFK